MRLSHSFILAVAMAVAAPAVAQNNAAAPINAITSAPAAPTTPSGQTTTLPPAATTPADTGTTEVIKTHRGFPWGVIGLIGLLGLLGFRKARS